MAHYFVVLKSIMKYNWDVGVRILLQSSTSKVIFLSSISNVNDFIDTVDFLSENLQKCEKINS